jgi:PKD repeat protein
MTNHFYSTIIPKILFSGILTVCLSFSSFAEETQISGAATKKASVNFTAIAIQESFNKPPRKPIKFIGNRKARVLNDELQLPSDIPYGKDLSGANTGNAFRSSAFTTTPPPVQSFNALNDNGSSIPPDVNGTVGPNHLMTTLNSQVRIQDRNGNVISTVTLDAFWSPLGGLNTFDPKILYDHVANRWMFCASANSESPSSSTLIGVSATSDPTGTWFLYKYDVDAANQKWVDYPSIGFNDQWIVVQYNLFPISSGGGAHKINVYNKADLYANGTGLYTEFNITDEGSSIVVPSINYDNSSPKIYLIQTATQGAGTLTMRHISGPVNAPVLSTKTAFTIFPWLNQNINFGPQYGSTALIATNDHRMRHVVLRNGKIWGVHTVYLPTGGGIQRSAVQWFQLDTLANVLQKGRIEDTNNGYFYSFPSIAVNKEEDAVIGFARFNATEYASGAYCYRKSTDAPNTFRNDYRLKNGEATYNKDFGSARNRWGDYSNTVLDPLNDTVFWTIQEYAVYPGSVWGTWWGKIDPRVPDYVDFTSDKQIICAGEEITFSDASTFTGTNYTWTFQNGTPATSTSANPVVKFSTAGVHDVTLEVDGKTILKNKYVSVLGSPNKVVNKSAASTFCAGKTATLTSAQAGGTYLWSTGQTSRSINVTTDGQYYVHVTIFTGCSVYSDTVNVVFNTPPTVTLDPLSNVDVNDAPFALSGGNPAGGTFSGPGVSSGTFSPSVAGLGTHNIIYTYSDANSCSASDTQSITVTGVVGVGSEQADHSFSVTPNPTQGIISMTTYTKSKTDLKVEVINAKGEVIYTKSFKSNNGSSTRSIDLSNEASGIYYLKLNMGGQVKTQKIVKE